jgi:hypothetical protein
VGDKEAWALVQDLGGTLDIQRGAKSMGKMKMDLGIHNMYVYTPYIYIYVPYIYIPYIDMDIYHI